MSNTNKYEITVDSQKHLRASVRKVIAKTKEQPDTWLTLMLSNKRGTGQIAIEIMSINGKPRFRLLGNETSNQTNVYEIAKRELNIEEWSKG